MSNSISNLSMAFTVFFILIPMMLSYWYALGLSRAVLWSSIRGSIQLVAIGFVLTYLFDLPPGIGIFIMLMVMITVASLHAAKKAQDLPHVKMALFGVITLIETGVLGMWLVFGMAEFTAEQVIPMSGMVIGNSMVAAGLALDRIQDEFTEGKGRILAALSLGATPKQASQLILRKTLQAAMIPNIDGLKTIGLVQLPGMMTGLILGGADPLTAIRYQIVISLSIFSAVSVSAMLVTLIMYRVFFNKQMQLRDFSIDNQGGR
ncbi:ABC transporter permease [Bacillus marinisedimentorum]|uniref:ABC transporter permease n=1 Tax=Bacillus marinisedimentorum TaxID=1821260 RepID=UPI0009F2D476|nr:iron export ABC transporter permease subunit FetB [Bacillus marinisedimentorum]